MSVIRIFLFGPPRVEQAGQEVSLNRRKMQALLAYLAVTGQPHSREKLSTLFWPENDSSSGLANLRRDLSRLRDAVGENVLLTERDQVRLNPGADVWLDVGEFTRLVDSAWQHDHPQSEGLCHVCAKRLEEAAGLYTADFMAGFNLLDCPEFDEWQFFEAEKLRQSFASLLQQLVQWQINRGKPQLGIEFARRWVALDILNEPAHRRLMELYALAGQQAAALRQYQTLARALDEDMDIEPDEETKHLYEAIRSRRFPAPLPEQPPSTPVQSPGDLSHSASRPKTEERYIREQLLQTGGFGEIYLGQDRYSGQPVAIKRLKPELVAERPDLVNRFLQEGEALRQLSHPNIVRMLDAYQADGQYFLVMEYLPGGTLRDLMDEQKQIPIPQALDICLELADAIARAHHLHILHRDLKPENVILSADGRPRLIDFGLARLERFDTRLTQAGLVFGSPSYMSPEALRGLELDARSDIWSFGVLMFELLAGRLPFEGQQVITVLNRILNDPLPDLLPLRPDVPDGLADLIRQMLVKDRRARLSSMRQIAAALEGIRDGYSPFSPTELPEEDEEAPAPAAGQAKASIVESAQATPVPQVVYSQSTPLIGREHELAEIHALLSGPECRLLTLMGTGGIGKTRLAVEVSAVMNDEFDDGTALVFLAPVVGVDNIIPAMLEVLQVGIRVGLDPKSQLLNFLCDRSMLLVLDNFEHLLDGADLLAEILARAPMVMLLVTSRERLNLKAEWVYEVGGLAYPTDGSQPVMDSQTLARTFPAVRLFVQRARKVRPDFTLREEDLAAVVKICRLVDGMPLALELAAPWVRAMTCAEIAQEIEHSIDLLVTSQPDVPDRHRSIRVVFEQSWERMPRAEQILLENLSVFAGGCTRKTAIQVTGSQPEHLAALVDRAFIRMRGDRLEMHELVRQFAHERLDAVRERHEEMVMRHSRYHLSMLAERTGDLKGGRQREALAELVSEIGNLRAAWQRAVRREDEAALAQAAEAFWLFNEFRGTLHEGEAAFRQAAERFLTLPYQARLAGFMLTAQGCMTARHGQLERGRVLMRQGIELQSRAAHPDQQMMVFSRAWLGFVSLLQGRYHEASHLMQENLALFPEIKDPWSQAGSLRVMGASLLFSGRLEEARRYLLQCLSICEQINERRIRTYALMNLAVIDTWQGAFERARQRFDEALSVSSETNDPLSKADAVRERTRLYLATGEYDLAMENIQSCLAIYHEVGRIDISAAINYRGWVYFYQDHPEQAEQAFREGLAAARLAGNRPDEASSLEGLARISFWQGDWVQTHAYLENSLEIWREIGHEPEMALILVKIGSAALRSGRGRAVEQARQSFQQALQIAAKHNLAPIALWVFMGLAGLLQRENDETRRNQAAQLLALVRDHPASLHPARAEAARLLQQVNGTEAGQPLEADWQAQAEQWIEWLNKKQPASI